MKKLLSSLVLLGMVLLFGACESSKLDSATYEMNQSGVTSNVRVLYDKDKKVQEVHMKNNFNYEKTGATKEETKEILDIAGKAYEKTEGLTYNVKYGEKEATQTLEIAMNSLSEDELYSLYSVDKNDEGSITFETFTKNLEDMGYTKK